MHLTRTVLTCQNFYPIQSNLQILKFLAKKKKFLDQRQTYQVEFQLHWSMALTYYRTLVYKVANDCFKLDKTAATSMSVSPQLVSNRWCTMRPRHHLVCIQSCNALRSEYKWMNTFPELILLRWTYLIVIIVSQSLELDEGVSLQLRWIGDQPAQMMFLLISYKNFLHSYKWKSASAL